MFKIAKLKGLTKNHMFECNSLITPNKCGFPLTPFAINKQLRNGIIICHYPPVPVPEPW